MTTGVALISSLLSFLLFVLGPGLAYFRFVSPVGGFGLWAAGGFLGMLSVITAAVVLFWKGWQAVPAGVIPGALVAIIFLTLSVSAMRYPAINDITTDPEAPVLFLEVVRTTEGDPIEYTYPAQRFAPLQERYYPDIQPLELKLPARQAFQVVDKMAREMPEWQLIRVDEQALVIEGIAESTIFKFKDDFVIQAQPRAGRTVIQMRSRSRQGRSDLGANAGRIRKFLSRVARQSTFELSE